MDIFTDEEMLVIYEHDNQTLADFWNIEDSEDTLSSIIKKVFDRISDISGTPIVENQSVIYDEPDYVFKGYEFEVDL